MIGKTVIAPRSTGLELPTRVRYQVLAAACLLALVAYLHRVGFAKAGIGLKSDLGLNDAQWGRVMAAFLVGYAVFEIPWGIFCDRLGARHGLVLVTLAWSTLTAAVAVVGILPVGPLRPFYLLLALRFLFGAFQAGAFPAISRVMADWMPLTERGTAQGLIWMTSRIGGAIAPLLLGWLVVRSGWEESLLSVSVLGFIWCALFWPWFRNRPEEKPGVNAAERELIAAGRGPRPSGHGQVPWKVFLRSRNVWALCLLYACGGCSATFFITLLPTYLHEHRRLPEFEVQLLLSLPLACGVLGCIGGGMFSDRLIRWTGNRKWGRRLNGFVGYFLGGVAMLSTIWARETWPLAILLCATFFFFDVAMGPAWAACADIGERYAGTLGGAMNMVGNFGAAAGAEIAGQLFGKAYRFSYGNDQVFFIQGNDLVFIIFAASFWLGSLLWLGVDATKPLVAHPPSGDELLRR